ncbi:MAG: hypothetical protein K1X81_03460 [Bacteroidia bacterium]|nr:hypothetical protein [Bacteroidia bacterium]
MKHLFFIFLFGSLHHIAICYPQERLVCLNDTLLPRVAIKLERDTKSFNVFKDLFKVYHKSSTNGDTIHEEYFDLYLSLYNKGTPLVRLIKKNTLDSVFAQVEQQYNTNSHRSLYESFCSVVQNPSFYNTDADIGAVGAQIECFRIFLTNYFILPPNK